MMNSYAQSDIICLCYLSQPSSQNYSGTNCYCHRYTDRISHGSEANLFRLQIKIIPVTLPFASISSSEARKPIYSHEKDIFKGVGLSQLIKIRIVHLHFWYLQESKEALPEEIRSTHGAQHRIPSPRNSGL